ncbi:MAG: serine/threonine-protein kinase [Akkermansiaceae bacterium]|nr:serine/threonine-protein kinase [Akkermansiaceae bacterium]
MNQDPMDSRKPMNAEPETTCSDCGKAYQPDLATGLGGCPHCLARMLEQESQDDDRADNTPVSFEAGASFGGVEILEPLACGGMGMVYKARQIKLNRIVALKVIDPKLAGFPEFTKRFEREAHALAVLNHPNVVQVYDFGQENELCYLVMEWVDGTSLREILSAGHLSPDDALRYLPQICDALEYAHAQGVVHRDIKPENILIDRQGQLKIADFGIARMRGDDKRGRNLSRGWGRGWERRNTWLPSSKRAPTGWTTGPTFIHLGWSSMKCLPGSCRWDVFPIPPNGSRSTSASTKSSSRPWNTIPTVAISAPVRSSRLSRIRLRSLRLQLVLLRPSSGHA